jgi:hypothetical protein
MCVLLCLCTGRGIATSWSPAQGILPDVKDLVNRSETESFMEVGLGPNEGCSAKGKKLNSLYMYLQIWSYRILKFMPEPSSCFSHVHRTRAPFSMSTWLFSYGIKHKCNATNRIFYLYILERASGCGRQTYNANAWRQLFEAILRRYWRGTVMCAVHCPIV